MESNHKIGIVPTSRSDKGDSLALGELVEDGERSEVAVVY